MSSPAATRPYSMGHALTVRPQHTAVLDGIRAALAFAASIALSSRHVGLLHPGPESLDTSSAVLLAVSTIPLVAWRRAPRGVFVLTMSARVLLRALGYSIGLLVGPTVALYLSIAY